MHIDFLTVFKSKFLAATSLLCNGRAMNPHISDFRPVMAKYTNGVEQPLFKNENKMGLMTKIRADECAMNWE